MILVMFVDYVWREFAHPCLLIIQFQFYQAWYTGLVLIIGSLEQLVFLPPSGWVPVSVDGEEF